MTKKQKIAFNVLRVIISLVFLSAGIPKLLGQEAVIQGFAMAGLPVWFMYCVGIGELLGVIGIWTKVGYRYAYEGMFIVLIGATITTAVFQSVVFALLPLAVLILLGIMVWL